MVAHLKEILRKEMLSKRNSLTKTNIQSASESILSRLFARPKFKEAKYIAFYLPRGNEVDTKKMIEESLKQGKTILVPSTDEKKITFHKFSSFDDLEAGKFNILEPKSKINPLSEPELIVIPGVAFGLCMHRLGYGKGYYDNYLASSFAYRIGIGYDFQIVEKLPSHENDQRMDEIITEKRIIM